MWWHIVWSGVRYLAEWMTYGYPTANVWPLDIKRFGNLQSSRTFLRHRVMEVMREWKTSPAVHMNMYTSGTFLLLRLEKQNAL